MYENRHKTSAGWLMQYSKLKYVAIRIFLQEYYIKEQNRVTRRFECINHEFTSRTKFTCYRLFMHFFKTITKRLSEYYSFTYMSTSTATITNSTHQYLSLSQASELSWHATRTNTKNKVITILYEAISSQDFCNLVLPVLPTTSKYSRVLYEIVPEQYLTGLLGRF